MPIRYTFLALMFLAASHLYSQTLQAAYARYQKATGKEKVAAANSFFATAKKAHVADTLYKVKRQYADSTTSTVRQSLHSQHDFSLSNEIMLHPARMQCLCGFYESDAGLPAFFGFGGQSDSKYKTCVCTYSYIEN
jgi:hypothetical protein